MPQRIRVYLTGNPPSNPFQHSAGLRALLYGLLERSDPSLAYLIHDANQAKPFAISPIEINSNDAGKCFFDFCILLDCFSSPLLEALSNINGKICLGNDEYAVCSWETISQADWGDLLNSSRYRKNFHFKILSPVAHHAPGSIRKSIVAPSPELYFGSWLNRWNLFCGRSMPDEMLDIISNYFAVSYFSGETKSVSLDKNRTFIGFVGEVKFKVLQTDLLPPDANRHLQALARFANFCGTGVETFRGMGQTRYIE